MTELISFRCPDPDCTNVIMLELLERSESARFHQANIRMVPGPRVDSTIDVVWMTCPDGHDFKVAFRSIHRSRFQG